MSAPPLILYDGVCGLCQRSIRFILRWERGPVLRFMTLQSEPAQALLKQYGIPADVDAMVLIEAGQAHMGAEAALRIARYLRPPPRWLAAFRILPRGLREKLYRALAARRYRWFGKTETCELPAPENADRFQ